VDDSFARAGGVVDLGVGWEEEVTTGRARHSVGTGQILTEDNKENEDALFCP